MKNIPWIRDTLDETTFQKMVGINSCYQWINPPKTWDSHGCTLYQLLDFRQTSPDNLQWASHSWLWASGHHGSCLFKWLVMWEGSCFFHWIFDGYEQIWKQHMPAGDHWNQLMLYWWLMCLLKAQSKKSLVSKVFSVKSLREYLAFSCGRTISGEARWHRGKSNTMNN